MEVVKIELNDGTVVYGVEVWCCCNDCNECGAKVEIYSTPRCRKKDFICELSDSIPDSDDYILEDKEEVIAYENAWNDFITKIENNLK